MQDTISNIRAAISFSKKPGNEGLCLANSKGVYRPVSEVLTPALDTLLAIETLISGIELGLNFDSDNAQRLLVIRNELATFKANLEPKHSNLNAAKAAMRGNK